MHKAPAPCLKNPKILSPFGFGVFVVFLFFGIVINCLVLWILYLLFTKHLTAQGTCTISKTSIKKSKIDHT